MTAVAMAVALSTAPASPADSARAAHERASSAMAEGRRALRELVSLRSRYAGADDLAALAAERDALRRRAEDAHRAYARDRAELLELRKAHQADALASLLSGPGRPEAAKGLLDSLEFDRLVSDLSGFGSELEDALREDGSFWDAAAREAGHARRVLWLAAGVAAAAFAALAWLAARR